MSWFEDWYNGKKSINPVRLMWDALPQNVRDTYTSGFNALVDMSTPAAVRDYTTSAQDTARSATQGDGWGTATNALATVNAALGAIPVAGMGVRLAQKGARDVGKVVGKEADNFIRAYHGSPHSFDKFDISKIGTGEGAQAYGHGLYFAENEGVAKGYRDTLTKSGSDWGQRALDKAGGDIDAAIATIQGKIDKYRAGGADSYATGQEEILRALQQYKQTGQWSPGSMYEVAIKADPEKFLDWDKPPTGHAAEMLSGIYPTNLPGRDIYQIMLHDARNTAIARGDNAATTLPASQARASQDLAELGIPGIKYLDQGSRAAGEGSRNYVVFDANTIEILRKYGLLPVAGAGALGFGAMQQDNQPQGLF